MLPLFCIFAGLLANVYADLIRVPDIPFDQENKWIYFFSDVKTPSAAYDPLPFPSTSSVITVENCMYVLAEGDIYVSSRKVF